jgi:2-methylisocitrate lyase-like PEP mutase family enzyme
MSSTRSDHAAEFRTLHAGPGLLILPNAWDAGSARVVEKAGARAIATSSAAVAWGHGYPDGQTLPLDSLVATLGAIVRVVDVPVSADIEAAYAHDAAATGATVARVIDAGAVGINVEDGRDSPDILCAKIERIKTVALRAGVDLWVNARTDVYLRGLVPAANAVAETVARGRRYGGAGADSLFVPGLIDEPAIARVVADVPMPLNVLAWPGLPPAHALERLGVRRLSAGTAIAQAAYSRTYQAAQTFLGVAGDGEPLLSTRDLNALMASVTDRRSRDRA